ncbi:chromate resistance protein ChrB domain-containing protein [Pelomonas sp. KK5]|uniref:chromate resistance protein ChrB domain-containing protein n=1 Tax=Pelomonas sp. KK5 TaxID=1855730 RepID=UPI00097CA361|nr:chromate resistance protein ChrB domain-containing protein [Pelomonas sp. KK5]
MDVEFASGWLLLILSLPTASTAARMRVWRGLKALGCMALRDGAYLLPASAPHEEALKAVAEDCQREGGATWLMAVQARDAGEEAAYRQLFDRTDDYAELRKGWKAAAGTLKKLSANELVRLQRRLTKEFEAQRAIDFFPADASAEAEAAWSEFSRRLQALISPDEPHQAAGGIARLDAAKYQGRTWATRRRLWVDRVASAWLIRRFIDPAARFKWLAKPADCPRSALGFDFDGAAFTHVGERVSFETLLASFGLEEDAALMRLAAMVHHLDVGGTPVPEAAGFEAVMAGARERLDDDDALLAEMSAVLDSLYAHFQRRKPE